MSSDLKYVKIIKIEYFNKIFLVSFCRVLIADSDYIKISHISSYPKAKKNPRTDLKNFKNQFFVFF